MSRWALSKLLNACIAGKQTKGDVAGCVINQDAGPCPRLDLSRMSDVRGRRSQ